MAWLEVETKVVIKDVSEMRKKVRKIARFKKKERRGDDYFALRRHGYPKKAFRVRAAGGEYVVNFKRWLKKYWTKDVVVKEEFEFELKTKEKLEHLLALFRDLGFVEWVKKRKTSESYRYKKDKRVVIEINRVEHLGYFLEIEFLASKNQMEFARRRIREVLKELGIKTSEINNTGYTKMLWNKGIKDKRYWID